MTLAGIPFWNWNAQRFMALAAMISLWTCIGCATLLQPIGPWGRPADLHVDSTTLSGVTVQTRCGYLKSNGEFDDADFDACDYLRGALQALGASEPAEAQPADLTLWYLEKGKGQTSCPTATSIAFAMTFGLFPCTYSRWSEAEFRVVDSRGVLLDAAPLRLEATTVVGWAAIGAQIFKPKKQRLALKQRFLRYAQNRIVSQAIRLPLHAQKQLNLDATEEEL